MRGLLGSFNGDGFVLHVRWRNGELQANTTRRPGLPAPQPMPLRLLSRDELLFEAGPYVGELAALERDGTGRVTGWEVCTYRFDRVD